MIELAKKIAQDAHAGQLYGTHDYFSYHVQGVASHLKAHGFSDKFIITAYLHDVVEDTSVTISEIYETFGLEIGDAVKAITKEHGVTRSEYLKKCASNEISLIVKFYDATFNASNCFIKHDIKRFEYYLDIIHALKPLFTI